MPRKYFPIHLENFKAGNSNNKKIDNDRGLGRARERHINFLNTYACSKKSGQPWDNPAVNQREKFIYFSCVSRRTHKLFGPINPGTTSRLSEGHLDVNQSKKFMCLFSPRKPAEVC